MTDVDDAVLEFGTDEFLDADKEFGLTEYRSPFGDEETFLLPLEPVPRTQEDAAPSKRARLQTRPDRTLALALQTAALQAFPSQDFFVRWPGAKLELEYEGMVSMMREPDGRSSKKVWVSKELLHAVQDNTFCLQHQVRVARAIQGQREEQLKQAMDVSISRNQCMFYVGSVLFSVIKQLMTGSYYEKQKARSLRDHLGQLRIEPFSSEVKLLCLDSAEGSTQDAVQASAHPTKQRTFVATYRTASKIWTATFQISSKSPTSTSATMAASTFSETAAANASPSS